MKRRNTEQKEPKATSVDPFERWFPDAKREPILLDTIPEDVRTFLNGRARLFVHPEDYVPNAYSSLEKLSYTGGDIGYVARMIKKYKGSASPDTEEITYLIDTRESARTGYAELRWNLTNKHPYFVNKPFEGQTRTEEDFLKQQLAERRIRVLHAIAEQQYGKPLYSDTNIEQTKMKPLWEKLVKEGLAKKFKEGKNDRYVIIENAP